MGDKKEGRYTTPSSESYQEGSNNKVLSNILGITDLAIMENKESELLQDAYRTMLDKYQADQKITENVICDLHKSWLGDVYSWAGEYRTVNMSKDGFVFAAAHLIPSLMQDFEKTHLSAHTPTECSNQDELARSLAIVHTEFILIHPFREGNGRLGRMISTLMALQAGYPILDFSEILGEERKRYFMAVQRGLDCDYDPMTGIFNSVLNKTLGSA